MNIHFRELAGESPLLVKLIMQSIYKEDRREIRALGLQTLGVQFLLKSVHSHGRLFYFHTETRNRSNVAFGRTLSVQDRGQESAEAHRHSGTGDRPGAQLQRGAGDGGKSDVRTVYAVRSSPYRTTSCWSSSCSRRTAAGTRPSVENADLVAARQINELKIK